MQFKPMITPTMTAALFLLVASITGQSPPLKTPQVTKQERDEWPMFGGNVWRNMVNPFAKNLPLIWNVDRGKEKNIKWVAELGTKAWGGRKADEDVAARAQAANEVLQFPDITRKGIRAQGRSHFAG